MGKGGISWKGRFEDGRKRQVYAKPDRKKWRFYEREKRFDAWEPLEHPLLEDWLELLDGVERRVHRRIHTEADLEHLRQMIKQKFPEAEC